MAAKTRWENLAILYDRMTPASQARLVERFVILHPDRLVELTALRAHLAEAKWETQGSGTGTGQ